MSTTTGDKAMDSTSESKDTFSRITFARLPLELQQAVWAYCLPHRIVELCPQADVTPNAVSEYAEPRLQVNRNRTPRPSAPPRIAAVAYQPRAQALAGGRWLTGAGGVPVWFHPQRDTVLLNGERVADYAVPAERPPTSQRLLDCLHEARGGVAVSGELLASHLGRHAFELLDRQRRHPDGNDSVPPFRGPLMVFFDKVAIRGTRQQAIDSGLFGLFLEMPRFIVRLDDADTIRRIRDLSRRPGVLHVGNAGFFRNLLKQAQLPRNKSLLEQYYLQYRSIPWEGHWRAPEALADMPHFKHVMLFHFCPPPTGTELH